MSERNFSSFLLLLFKRAGNLWCHVIGKRCYSEGWARQKGLLARNILNYNKSVSSGGDDELAHFVKWQSHKMAACCIHMTALAGGKGKDGTNRETAESGSAFVFQSSASAQFTDSNQTC